jgi:PIN domain nuclease of toxin-antitoxin system
VILLDTHTWLWWVATEGPLSPAATTAISDAASIGIPTVACMEVATLARRRRIDLAEEVEIWIARALAQDRVEAVPLTSQIAARAGSLGDDFVGDPADRIIYASAIATGRRLVTRDRFLRRFDPARTVW